MIPYMESLPVLVDPSPYTAPYLEYFFMSNTLTKFLGIEITEPKI